MPTELHSFLQQVFSHGSRSTALKPLGWAITLSSASSISSFHFNAPNWLGILFGVFAGLSFLLYLTAYVFFAVTDKDALRSEKYYLQKLAIQKGFVGDDLTGYIKLTEPASSQPVLELTEPSKEDQK